MDRSVETATIKAVETAMLKSVPKSKRYCYECGRITNDEHETICIKCGAGTRGIPKGK